MRHNLRTTQRATQKRSLLVAFTYYISSLRAVGAQGESTADPDTAVNIIAEYGLADVFITLSHALAYT